MLIEMSVGWIVGLNVGGWLAIQLGLAWAFTRMPAGWFSDGTPLATRNTKRRYERFFAIKRWKDRLPDAAHWFEGGFAKRALDRTDPGYLRRFIRETRRGEACHWCALACAPVFFLWNPWWGNAVIVAYALAANLPCILAQRYNRARMGRLLRRRGARAN